MKDSNPEQQGIVKKTTESKIIYTLGGSAVIAFVVVFVIYVLNFEGGISGSQTKWSEFGGYFSGVLLPVISLLTLIALLKTIFLQREMIKLQDDTFRAQIKQAGFYADEAAQSALDSRKSMLLSVVDKITARNIRDSENLTTVKRETLQSFLSISDFEEREKIKTELFMLQARIGEVENKRLSLDSVFYEISMTNYSSIEELQSHYEKKMFAVFKE